MLQFYTGLTDPRLEQVENHRTDPKIQGQQFSVVNKNHHNPLPPLPHKDRHTGLYTACKPSENTSSRQNCFYASCRKKGKLWKSIKQQNYFNFFKSYCYTSFKTVSVEEYPHGILHGPHKDTSSQELLHCSACHRAWWWAPDRNLWFTWVTPDICVHMKHLSYSIQHCRGARKFAFKAVLMKQL